MTEEEFCEGGLGTHTRQRTARHIDKRHIGKAKDGQTHRQEAHRQGQGDTKATERRKPHTERHPAMGKEQAGREGRGIYLEVRAAHKTNAHSTKPDHGRGHAQE